MLRIVKAWTRPCFRQKCIPQLAVPFQMNHDNLFVCSKWRIISFRRLKWFCSTVNVSIWMIMWTKHGCPYDCPNSFWHWPDRCIVIFRPFDLLLRSGTVEMKDFIHPHPWPSIYLTKFKRENNIDDNNIWKKTKLPAKLPQAFFCHIRHISHIRHICHRRQSLNGKQHRR